MSFDNNPNDESANHIITHPLENVVGSDEHHALTAEEPQPQQGNYYGEMSDDLTDALQVYYTAQDDLKQKQCAARSKRLFLIIGLGLVTGLTVMIFTLVRMKDNVIDNTDSMGGPPDANEMVTIFPHDNAEPVIKIEEVLVPPAPHHISSVCSLKSVASIKGYTSCNSLCLRAECCFSPPNSDTKIQNCYDSNQETCPLYQKCNLLTALTANRTAIHYACGDATKLSDPVVLQACRQACEPAQCCFADNLGQHRNSCVTKENSIWCDQFASCLNLLWADMENGIIDGVLDLVIPMEEEAEWEEQHLLDVHLYCTEDSLVTHEGREVCAQLCRPFECCVSPHTTDATGIVNSMCDNNYESIVSKWCVPNSPCNLLYTGGRAIPKLSQIIIADKIVGISLFITPIIATHQITNICLGSENSTSIDDEEVGERHLVHTSSDTNVEMVSADCEDICKPSLCCLIPPHMIGSCAATKQKECEFYKEPCQPYYQQSFKYSEFSPVKMVFDAVCISNHDNHDTLSPSLKDCESMCEPFMCCIKEGKYDDDKTNTTCLPKVMGQCDQFSACRITLPSDDHHHDKEEQEKVFQNKTSSVNIGEVCSESVFTDKNQRQACHDLCVDKMCCFTGDVTLHCEPMELGTCQDFVDCVILV